MRGGRPFRWLMLWVGTLVAAAIGVGAFVGGSYIEQVVDLPIIVVGVFLAVLVVGIGLWLHRSGQTEIGLGLVGGYAILSLISRGECTLLLPPRGDEEGVFTGFFLYPVLVVGSLVVGLIIHGVLRITRTRNEEDQP